MPGRGIQSPDVDESAQPAHTSCSRTISNPAPPGSPFGRFERP
jgi:hypothetical protein